MREIIGNTVEVFLKRRYDEAKDNIMGLLVDVTDRTLYVQSCAERVFAIPRENVEFCTTDALPPKSRQFVNDVLPRRGPPPAPDPNAPPVNTTKSREEAKIIDRLNVYINSEHLASIPIPPTFPIEQWNDKIMRVIMGNPDVKTAVAGKIQKSIEYFPGEVYIEVEMVEPPSQMPEIEPQQGANTFAMGGSPATEYLNPSQMVARLNKVARGKTNDNDEEQT